MVNSPHNTAPPSPSEDFELILDKGRLSATQIRVVFISFLLMILDGFDITSMSFTAQRISTELNIDATNLGVIFSVTLAGMMLGAMFIAPIADKIGRRKMLIISVLVIGISMTLTGFVSTLWELIILRTITGLGVGSMLANITALTTEYTPTKYRSFGVAIVASGFPLGATLGGIIVVPTLPVYGWEGVFIGLGIITSIMTVVVYFLVPESLQFLRTIGTDNALLKTNALLRKMNKQQVSSFPVKSTNILPKASVMSLLAPPLRAKTIRLWLTFLLVFVSMYFLMSWLPKLVINSGLSESSGVLSAVALNGGGVVGTLLLGWFAANFGLTKLVGIFLTVAGSLLLLFGVLFEYLNLFLLLFVIGFFLQGAYVGLYSTSAKLYPTEVRATGIGWALGLGRFGAVIGPYVGGVFIASGFSMQLNFLIFSVPLLIAAILAWGLKIR
ncbi:MFS transporter [Paraglaciecola arctica]|uniref:MFS transporter, AAHS family, 4-hydroxybenzoate transporter n=1 Tax=Paraglaciecola arctica BSs20135 TaxID=493475 RepID=K6Z5J1_9ALTE|nr:MFS transporter [Paraglaciecola arctica]GAC18705.1 MFS transporter, AAHS family, 4-hydroxybenzoate transporter [Paraglaciecola arctica BSs20135]